MIRYEKLQGIRHIIAHANCPDGMASAMILRHVFPEAKIRFVQYRTEEHKKLPLDPGMIFVDFSPPIERVQEFLDVEAIVLDHHKGPAKAVAEAFAKEGLGVYADADRDPGVSGAVLAYRIWYTMKTTQVTRDVLKYPHLTNEVQREFGLRNEIVENFATLAGIWDTWQKKDERWLVACEQAAALSFWPFENISIDPLRWEECLRLGPLLYKQKMKNVDQCLKGAYRFTTPKGLRVTVFEGTKTVSDAAEKVAKESDLTIGLAFFVDPESGEPKMIFSNRSRGTFNCKNFSVAHGGGGHDKAAGFHVLLSDTDPQPFALAKRIVEQYEAVLGKWEPIVSSETFDQDVKDGKINPVEAFRCLLSSSP